jgi:hypothetical protein
MRLVVNGGRQDSAMQAAAAQLRTIFALPPKLVTSLDGRSVAVYPQEAQAIWAYRIPNWHPLPVFQAYSAYTPKLDRLNADALASATGPEAVLLQTVDATDGRFSAFESPAAVVSLLCNYRTERDSTKWAVLGRISNRCGPERLMATVRTRFNDTLRVPPAPSPDSLVIAKVQGTEVHGIELLRELLLRPYKRFAVLNGSQVGRLVPDTAPEGLLMRAPRWVYPHQLSARPNTKTLRIFKEGDLSDRSTLTVSFYAVPVTGGPVAKARPSPAGPARQRP